MREHQAALTGIKNTVTLRGVWALTRCRSLLPCAVRHAQCLCLYVVRVLCMVILVCDLHFRVESRYQLIIFLFFFLLLFAVLFLFGIVDGKRRCCCFSLVFPLRYEIIQPTNTRISALHCSIATMYAGRDVDRMIQNRSFDSGGSNHGAKNVSHENSTFVANVWFHIASACQLIPICMLRTAAPIEYTSQISRYYKYYRFFTHTHSDILYETGR